MEFPRNLRHGLVQVTTEVISVFAHLVPNKSKKFSKQKRSKMMGVSPSVIRVDPALMANFEFAKSQALVYNRRLVGV